MSSLILNTKVQRAEYRENFEAMKSQSFIQPTIQDGAVSPYVNLDGMLGKVANELLIMYNITGDTPPSLSSLYHPKGDIANDQLLLRNNSALVYSVPRNTTLIEVLGAVGDNKMYGQFGDCYAYLDPRPSWWLTGNFPTVSCDSMVNATNQTLFFLPIDPEISFELRVGALGSTTTCPVSAIRTYPFH